MKCKNILNFLKRQVTGINRGIMFRPCFHSCADCTHECPKCGAPKHQVNTDCDLCNRCEKFSDLSELNKRAGYIKYELT